MALKKYIVDLMQDNPLNGISTYIDVLTLSTGAISKKIKKLVLNGTENIQRTDNCFRLVVNGISPENEIMCSHFSKTTGYSLRNGGVGIANYGNFYGAAYRGFYIRDDSLTTDVTAFKTYLSQQYANDTPVTVWYVLETPITEQITVPTGLSGTVDGYTTQTGTPTPTNPIYPTANTVTMWANYTPPRYNGTAFVTATGQPEQYNGGWT